MFDTYLSRQEIYACMTKISYIERNLICEQGHRNASMIRCIHNRRRKSEVANKMENEILKFNFSERRKYITRAETIKDEEYQIKRIRKRKAGRETMARSVAWNW